MIRWGVVFLLYFLSTAGLNMPIFLLGGGDETSFYRGMTVVGEILITNIIVLALQMHHEKK
ncbi:MAG: hypothetical protein WCF90_04200 [Methanomicrobiales archaeon]